MALIHCDFFSDVLKMGMSMKVILPQPAPPPPEKEKPGGTAVPAGMIGLERDSAPAQGSNSGGGGFPTLWLLHGLSDDHGAWCRRTSIERYVSGRNLAVVMPNVDRSYYADMARGHAYWTYISEELPRIARGLFPLSTRREDNFTAGLSMGGYGAFKLALNHPERYAAAASLSGALDPSTLFDDLSERRDEWANVYGDPPRIDGTESDLFHRAGCVAKGEHADLPLYACCGTADFLYEHTTRFRDHTQKLGLDLTYEEHAGADHEWGYWDQQIKSVLDWLPLDAAEASGV